MAEDDLTPEELIRQAAAQFQNELNDDPDSYSVCNEYAWLVGNTEGDLERALEQLPEGCRQAFVLHDVEGFDHKEVAGLLGIAEGTSKSQVFKARGKLRALLK